MTRKPILLFAIAAWALTGGPVQAQNVHLKGTPEITVSDTTLTFSACLAGLGNQDVKITVVAEGTASVVCLNPSGQFVPGQNRVPVTAEATTTIKRTEVKNGNVCFTVTAEAPEEVDPLDAGCPNRNWTALVDEVEFTAVLLIVEQGNKVVLEEVFVAP